MIVREDAPTILLCMIPPCLSAVFLADVIGPIAPTVSILYLPLIAIATRAFNRKGVSYIGLICVVLTCISFILSKVEGFQPMALLQIMATVVAIIATTVLSVMLSSPRDPAA